MHKNLDLDLLYDYSMELLKKLVKKTQFFRCFILSVLYILSYIIIYLFIW